MILTLFIAACSSTPSPTGPSPTTSSATTATLDLADELLKLPSGWQQRAAAQWRFPRFPQRIPPPPDDAPLDVLAGYWEGKVSQRGNTRGLVISDKARERLLEAVIAQPHRTPDLLGLLPNKASAHAQIKRLYDEYPQKLGADVWSHSGGSGGVQTVRKFLMRNTAYFRDELIRDAGDARDGFAPSSAEIQYQEEVEAFAALDFARAEPLLRRYAADPMPLRAILAKSLLLAHDPNSPESDRFRVELQKIVEDRSAGMSARSLAIKGLFTPERPVTAQLLRTLLRDPLDHGGYVPVVYVVAKDPDRWVPIVAKLVGDPDRTVRSNAVQCLVQFDGYNSRRDALEPLLPWLFDRTWVSTDGYGYPFGRLGLIQSMVNLDLRESIPGLIAVLKQNSPSAEKRLNELDEQSWAAGTISYFKAKEAAPALRDALASTARFTAENRGGPYRRKLMIALIEVGGLSDTEELAAIEAYLTSGVDVSTITEGANGGSRPPASDEVTIGWYLADHHSLSEATVARLLSRVEELKASNPSMADRLLQIAHRPPSAAGDQDIARRIADKIASATSIQAALQRHKTFAGNTTQTLRESLSLSGIPAGIFAMLSGDSKRIEGVLDGADNDAIRALLASARIAGELLPYDAVDRVFNSRDPGAQRAAEIYLVANDSPRARAILDARFNGTVIVGGREIQASRDFSVNLFEEQERQLLAKMKGDNAADEVFALLRFSGSGWSDKTAREEIVIERRGDQITGARQGSNVANTTRFVSPQEFSKLKFFIESEKVDDLGPISNLVFDATWIVEYVHLTRESARRVYMHNAILVGHKAAYQTIGEEFQRLVPAASAP